MLHSCEEENCKSAEGVLLNKKESMEDDKLTVEVLQTEESPRRKVPAIAVDQDVEAYWWEEKKSVKSIMCKKEGRPDVSELVVGVPRFAKLRVLQCQSELPFGRSVLLLPLTFVKEFLRWRTGARRTFRPATRASNAMLSGGISAGGVPFVSGCTNWFDPSVILLCRTLGHIPAIL